MLTSRQKAIKAKLVGKRINFPHKVGPNTKYMWDEDTYSVPFGYSFLDEMPEVGDLYYNDFGQTFKYIGINSRLGRAYDMRLLNE